VGWFLLLAALFAVALLDVPSDSGPSVAAPPSRAVQASPVDTLCVGNPLEVRMCKVARDGFTIALDY
jgi:hypothetical protein